MVPFSGWCMPVQYSGIISEHLHTRTEAGLFDICHMGEFYLTGRGALKDLERILTCPVDSLDAGRCRYGFMLNEKGGIIDDLIVFRLDEEEFLLVVNAGRSEVDKEWILEHLSGASAFRDRTADIAKIDIQGPLSGKVLESTIGPDAVKAMKRFSFGKYNIEGEEVLVSRTGYTGELGYELFMPVSSAVRVWEHFLSFDEVRPIGLGARDTLRMEKGFCLYGSDIDEDHTPFQAGLSRFVCMEKDFIGKSRLENSLPEILLRGFVCEGRRSARARYKVMTGGQETGEVTSAGFSPCLKKGIGLCYMKKEFSGQGQEVVLSDGKVEIKAEIKDLPLV